jgi:hypothetical protein
MRQARPKRVRGQSWKTFLRTHVAEMWTCAFVQVTDLFFRPLFARFNTLANIAQSHPCACDTIPHRCLGGAYRCEKRLHTGKHPPISSGIMTSNVGQVLREWPQSVGLRRFELPIEHLRRMSYVNVFWEA